MTSGETQTSDVDVDLGRLFSSLKRDWRRIALFTILVTAIVFVLVMMATPLYRAETRLLIEERESVYTRPQNAGDRSTIDAESVASQVQVITSTENLARVARDLHLADREEFSPGVSLLGRLRAMAGLGRAPSQGAEDRLLEAIRDKLSVYRVENSRVIVIQFSSEDPELAARVPDAIADAYLASLREAKSQSNADATEWLQPEIADLSEKVKEAEAKVADFRAKTGLLIGQNNTVLPTQQLAELSSELSRVRANRSAAEARAETVRTAIENGAAIETLPDVMASSLIQRLRERQVELRAQIADLSTTLLSNHPRVRALQSQLADLDGQIRAEARRIEQGLQTEAEAARRREEELTAELDRLKAESARAEQQQVELRALEREAAAQRELLETYLTRYREAAARGERNYLPVDARIFSRAIVPAAPYFPKVAPLTLATFAASLLVMAVITLLRELFSGRAMRPVEAFSEAPEREPQAVPPESASPGSEVAVPPPAVAEELRPDTGGETEEVMVAAEEAEAVAVADETETAPEDQEAEISQAPETTELSDFAEEQETGPTEPEPAAPNCARGLAEGLPEQARRGLGEVDIEVAAEALISTGVARAIFVSPEGDEAAATAVLVAREVADAGLRVLLLDLTTSGAATLPMLESKSYPGITNLLAAEAQFSDVIHADLYSNCHIIPVGTADPERSMRAVDRLPIIMESLTIAYDLVVVECGPADAASLRALTGEDAQVLVSVLDPEEDRIAAATAELAEEGFGPPLLVTPAGYVPPTAPPGRDAA